MRACSRCTLRHSSAAPTLQCCEGRDALWRKWRTSTAGQQPAVPPKHLLSGHRLHRRPGDAMVPAQKSAWIAPLSLPRQGGHFIWAVADGVEGGRTGARVRLRRPARRQAEHPLRAQQAHWLANSYAACTSHAAFPAANLAAPGSSDAAAKQGQVHSRWGSRCWRCWRCCGHPHRYRPSRRAALASTPAPPALMQRPQRLGAAPLPHAGAGGRAPAVLVLDT